MIEESRTTMADGRLIINLKLLGSDFESLHQLAGYLDLNKYLPACKFVIEYSRLKNKGVIHTNDVHKFLAWWRNVQDSVREVKNSLDLVCDNYTYDNLNNLSDVLLDLRKKLLSLDCKYLPTIWIRYYSDQYRRVEARDFASRSYISHLLKKPNNHQLISMLVANYRYRDKFKSPKRWRRNIVLLCVGLGLLSSGFGGAPMLAVGILGYTYSPIDSDAHILVGMGAGILLLGALIGCIVGCCEVAKYNNIFSHEKLKTFNNTNIFGQLLSANSVPTPGSALGTEESPVIAYPIVEADIVHVVNAIKE